MFLLFLFLSPTSSSFSMHAVSLQQSFCRLSNYKSGFVPSVQLFRILLDDGAVFESVHGFHLPRHLR
jgi:hypothetical protein